MEGSIFTDEAELHELGWFLLTHVVFPVCRILQIAGSILLL